MFSKGKLCLASLLSILLLFATFIVPNSASAQDNGDSLSVDAKSAILVDAKTGKVLFAKNPDKPLPPASMTKMMTEYLILQAIEKGKINWNSAVPISQKVQDLSRDPNFSGFSLRRDYTYHVDGMFDALLIPSSNAAAVAFAELLAGNESNFVDKMNQTAKKLGMKNTRYINASGLDNSDLGKYKAQGGDNATDNTTARDLAILAYHLLNDFPKKISDKALEAASTAEKTFQAGPGNEIDHMVSTNWMLPNFSKYTQNMHKYEYDGVDGFKTGFTGNAGYCFTGTVQRGDQRLISVVMGATDDSGNLLTTPGPNGVNEGKRFLVTKQLFDYGFQQFASKEVVKAGYQFKNHKTLPVVKGKSDNVGIEVKDSVKFPVKAGDEKNYKPVLHLDKSLLNKDGELTAPIKKGQKVGYITVENKGNDKLGYLYAPKQIPVVTTDAVQKANWFVLMFRGIGHFFGSIFSGIGHLITGLF